MNIKFGMNNFYVRYLKRFLNSEMRQTSNVLGKFNQDDLDLLIKYLNTPNVETLFSVQKDINTEFPELRDLFTEYVGDNYITWTSKRLSGATSEFLRDRYNDIKDFCKSVGWEVVTSNNWIDISYDVNGDGNIDMVDRAIIYDIAINGATYDEETMKRADLNLDGKVDSDDLIRFDAYAENTKLYLTIKALNRKNYFPNKDMLIFINQFKSEFIYNYVLRDSTGITDLPHEDPTKLHKLAIYECTPGQKITIAHNNPNPVHLVIGSSPVKLRQNLKTTQVVNVVEMDLLPGTGFQYTCSSTAERTGGDAHYVVIQCPSDFGDLSGTRTITETLDVGDINFDGKIDMDDYHLLASYTATGPGSEELHWNPTPKQLAVMDIDVTNPGIGVKDAERLYRFINGDPSIPSLGTTDYTYSEVVDKNTSNNVSNFLIIDGHYPDNFNIPFVEFIQDDWVIHEKFFNYLLGMAVTRYSNSEDISYMQKLLKQIYTEYAYDDKFFYPGNYSDEMLMVVASYQWSKNYYTKGDLNKDGKLDTVDLEILQTVIENSRDYNLCLHYIQDPVTYPLTPEEFIRLDKNEDGVVDSKDLQIIQDERLQQHSQQVLERADVNSDGFIDEQDYNILEANVNGETDSLTQYKIPFILGWIDVQTEKILEDDVNSYGFLSEVSK